MLRRYAVGINAEAKISHACGISWLHAPALYKYGYSKLESRMDHGSSLIRDADISICQDPVALSGVPLLMSTW